MSLLSWRRRMVGPVSMTADTAWGVLAASAAGAPFTDDQLYQAVVRALLDLKAGQGR